MGLKITNCQSCGLPLENPEQHACNDLEIPYCVRCITPHGLLGSKDQIKAQLVKFYTDSLKMKKVDAQEKADAKIALLFS